jgi:hypothetical protein
MRLFTSILFASTFLATALPAQDPVKVAPKSYTVLLDNDQVRVLKSCLKPGETIPTHSHNYRVIYELTDQRSRFTFPAAPPVVSSSKAGTVKWGTPVTHSEENIGDTDGCALIVELKETKNSLGRP